MPNFIKESVDFLVFSELFMIIAYNGCENSSLLHVFIEEYLVHVIGVYVVYDLHSKLYQLLWEHLTLMSENQERYSNYTTWKNLH